MSQLDFSRARAVVFDSNIARAQDTRSALRSLGFVEISTTHKINDFTDKATTTRPDLIVADASDHQSMQVITDLRTGIVGENPFCVVIMTTSSGSVSEIRQQMASGVDDLLLRPFGHEELKRRICRMAEARKPFVVSGGYVGPCRRGDEERASASNTMEVPNTLRDLGTGNEVRAEATRTWLKNARKDLTRTRLRLLCIRISAAAKLGREGDAGVRIRAHHQLRKAIEDLQRQLTQPTAELAKLITLLDSTASKLGDDSPPKQYILLHELAMGVLAMWREADEGKLDPSSIASSLDDISLHLTSTG
jgi:DNA-binding response OmpR family regulator